MTHLPPGHPLPAPAILVVDDDPQILKLMHAFLSRAGYVVYAAGNTASAMELLRETKVHLVVLDLFMPDQDGFEMIRALRRSDNRFKILVMSGHAKPFLRIAAELGADAVISKPFRQEELLAYIRDLLAEPATA